MSRRESNPERMRDPFALPRERTLELVRDVAATVTAPEDMPRKPAGFLTAGQAADMRRANPEADDLRATNMWHTWAGDVEQRNRKRFASLLWACHELRAWRGEDEFNELGQPLSHALVRFGASGQVPECPVERRQMVEEWRHPRQRDEMRGAA